MAQTHELAERDYILGMKYREIAEKYNVSVATVKSWKTRYNWERDKPVKTAKKNAYNAYKNEKVCIPKKEVQEPEEELTDKEQLFCYHFVRTRNATQAALLSGYSQNKACAQVQGSRLLARPRVKQEIDRLRELFRQDLHIEAMDVLQQYVKIAFADVGDYVSFGKREQQVIGMYGPVVDNDKKPVMEIVSFVDLSDSGMLDTSVLSEIKQGRDGVGVKLADKMKALEKLELYLDLLPDQWKRRMDEEKLKLSKAKLLLDIEKAKGENKENQHVDALRKKMSERKMKNGSS